MMNLTSAHEMSLDEVDGFPAKVRCRWRGALKITTDGEATIRGKVTTAAFFIEAGEVEQIVFSGTTVATIEHGLALSALGVAELQEIVEWADVETSAGTASGLRRAIERHFEEG